MLCERCHVREAGFARKLCLLCELEVSQIAARKRLDLLRPSTCDADAAREAWVFHGVPTTKAQRKEAEREESEYLRGES